MVTLMFLSIFRPGNTINMRCLSAALLLAVPLLGHAHVETVPCLDPVKYAGR